MKKNRLFKLATSLLTLFVITLSACNKNNGENSSSQDMTLSLSESQITLTEGGAPHQLTVYDGNNPYLGQISWASNNTTFATVYQGIVKGVRAGSTVISAKIDKVVLNCNVTINPNLSADIDNMTVYSGSGDINVTLMQTELVPGSTAKAIVVKDSTGTKVDNCLYESNGAYFLRNNAENKLEGGKYYVEYSISNTTVTITGTKTISVKPADSYKDLFVLDPIDGKEDMFGCSVNQDSYPNRYDPNPGQYVHYYDEANTGFTEENNLYENRGSFLNGLKESGYNGYFADSTIPGYDMTYRLYCRKDNYTSAPKPFFFLGLYETSNPMWNNLDQFPSEANIEIWVRSYFRAYDERYYHFNQMNFMYVFKGMNDKDTYYEGCSSFATSTNKEYGWSKYTISVNKAKNYLSGTKRLPLAWETNSTVPGEFYFEIYSVEVSGVSSYQYAPNKTIKNSLIGQYTNAFDSFDIEVLDKQTNTKLTPNVDFTINSENITFNVPTGAYEVTYKAKKGETSVFDIKKMTYVGVAANLSSADEINRSGWLPETTSGYLPESPVGLPSETLFGNTGVCYVKTQKVAGRAIPAFQIGSVLSDINNIPTTKKLVINCYFTHSISSHPLNFYLSVGWPHIGGATPTNNGMTIYYNGGWGGHPIENQPTEVNQWTTIEIPISTIKSFMATRPDIVPDVLSFEMRYGDNNNDYAYFYSIVLK